MHRFEIHSSVSLLLALGMLPVAARAQQTPAGPAVRDSLSNNPACVCPTRRPDIAALYVLLNNVLVNLVDRTFQADKEQFHVTPASVWANVKHSFEWDDNNFKTNQFAHPYAGSTYFNSGRANGMTFWESAPYAAMGSLMWEFAGEKNPPAINDFVATTVGGIALGEIFHRTATLIRNNEDRGTSRFLRELAALPVDPVGAFHRFVTGDFKRVGGNPEERQTDRLVLQLSTGYLRFTGDIPLGGKRDGVFFDLNMDYGDAFRKGPMGPYDVFEFRVEKATRDSGFPTRLQGEGVLLPLYSAENNRIFLTQRFDFISNTAYLFGGQSLSGRLDSRFRFSEKVRANTRVGLTAILVGAVNSEFVGLPQRNYDFGPGFGLTLSGTLHAGPRASLSANLFSLVLFTLAGDDGHHQLQAGSVDLQIPIIWGTAIAGRLSFYRRDSYYPNDLHTTQQSPEYRVYATWRIG